MFEYGGHWIIKWLLLLLLLKLLLTESNGALGLQDNDTSNIYTLIAPNEIRPYSLYTVVLAIFNAVNMASFEVSLSGYHLNMSMQMHVTNIFPTSSHTFVIPQIEKGNYMLNIKSLSNLAAIDSKHLNWVGIKKYVKIQIPKGIFRPGQTLQFRAFFHNESNHAIRPDISTQLWVEDSMGYRVRVFNNLIVNNGIFEGQMRLSRVPNLGVWRICVQDDARTLDECIKVCVDNYELSNIDIALDAPTDVYLSEKRFNFTVNVRHELDGQVNGPIRVTITKYNSEPDEQSQVLERDAQLVKGEVTIAVDILKLEPGIPDSSQLSLLLTVSVKDNSTRKVQKASQIVRVWKFHAPQAALLEEQNIVESNNDRLQRLRAETNVIKINNFGRPLNIIQRVVFPREYEVHAALCIVLFNGAILQSQMVFPDKKNNIYEIYVELTRNMYPMTKVLLYTMEANSNILLAATQYIILKNSVANVFIEQPIILTPESDLQLHIRAEPNSYVGLLAIDNRVNELGIPPKIMNNEMTKPKVDFVILTNAMKTSELAIETAVVVKEEPGVTVMPKAKEKQEEIPVEVERTKKYMCCDLPKIVQEFNDVWIYDSISTNSNWSEYRIEVPPGIHNWRLSAFSVDPQIGLTSPKPKPFINAWSNHLLYISAKLPSSIRFGEILPIHVTCFNWDNTFVNVLIRLRSNNQKFQLVDKDKNLISDEELYDNSVLVPSNGTATVTFYVRPIKRGQIDLAILLYTDEIKDILRTHFEVEGLPGLQKHQIFYHTVLNIHTTTNSARMELPYQPTDSGVTCSASGHIIRPLLASLTLVAETDNAEQVVSKLIAIYHLFSYLRKMPWCSPLYVKFLEEQLSDGLQTLMRFRGLDGGYRYNYAIKNNTCESSWLTAYVIKFLQYLENVDIKQFKTYSPLESEKFLLQNRGAAGQFEERCSFTDRRNLTLIELNLEVIKVLEWSKSLLDLKKSQQWLIPKMENNINYYYEAKQSISSIEWMRPDQEFINGSWIQYRQELETAARILSMTVREETFLVQQMEIFHWLLTQKFQNNHKIYCYECSVAEAAIYDYLNTLVPQNSLLDLKLWIDPEETRRIQISYANQGQEQEVLLVVGQNQKKPAVNIKIDGSGPVFVRCQYEYMPKNPKKHLYYVVVRQIEENACKCCVQRFKRDQNEYIGTNVNLQLPSGYVLDEKTVTMTRKKKLVKQAVSLTKNTELFVSMAALPPSILYCFLVTYKQIYTVKNLNNGTISVYDRNRSKLKEIFPFNLDEDIS